MTPRVDQLLERFREAHRADGTADPRPYLDELDGDDRAELAALIGAFLADAPGRPYDAAAYEAVHATPAARGIMAAAAAQRAASAAESWATLLPAARDEAQVTRRTVVQRLAKALGVAGKEDRVADYYHLMETGRLDPAGVSPRVLQALADIVQVPAERLRAAGRRLLPPASAAGAPVFARSSPAPIGSPCDEADLLAQAPEPAGPDEVDELFTGGSDEAA